jgi:hypothetical protein
MWTDFSPSVTVSGSFFKMRTQIKVPIEMDPDLKHCLQVNDVHLYQSSPVKAYQWPEQGNVAVLTVHLETKSRRKILSSSVKLLSLLRIRDVLSQILDLDLNIFSSWILDSDPNIF